jgi:hypothetical protein
VNCLEHFAAPPDPTTTSGVKVAQHSKGLKKGLILTMAPGGGTSETWRGKNETHVNTLAITHPLCGVVTRI